MIIAESINRTILTEGYNIITYKEHEGGKDMAEVKRNEGYTKEQINGAKRLIEVLIKVPEEKQALFTAVATAYIDGVETGARITKEMEGTTV